MAQGIMQFTDETASRLYGDIDDMAAYWEARKERFIGAANDEFLGVVNPDAAYGDEPDERRLRCLSLCFTEWLLFERSIGTAGTLLSQYLAYRPRRAGIQALRRLAEVRDTQFFARFRVHGREPAEGLVELQDTGTERDYTVYDPHLARLHPWRDRAVSQRIARVGGAWIFVGKTRFVDRSPVPRGVRDPLGEGDGAADGQADGHGGAEAGSPQGMPAWRRMAVKPCYYLRLLRDVVGVDGRYSQGARFRCGDGTALAVRPEASTGTGC